jgi:cold shock CspA family protein
MKDVFLHVSALPAELLPFSEALLERRIRFDIIDGKRGPVACNVRVNNEQQRRHLD